MEVVLGHPQCVPARAARAKTSEKKLKKSITDKKSATESTAIIKHDPVSLNSDVGRSMCIYSLSLPDRHRKL